MHNFIIQTYKELKLAEGITEIGKIAEKHLIELQVLPILIYNLI